MAAGAVAPVLAGPGPQSVPAGAERPCALAAEAGAWPAVHRTVGRVVCLLRKARGWRQRDLAARAGLRQPNVSRLESGTAAPRPETLARLARVFGLSVEELLSEERALDAEGRLRAALTPRNAGQLLAGRLSPVPLYRQRGPHALRFDAQGRPAGNPELILQLPPLPGMLFGLHNPAVPENLSKEAGLFTSGEVLVFSTEPPPARGDLVLARVRSALVFGRLTTGASGRVLGLASLTRGGQGLRLSRAAVGGMWRLVYELRRR